MRLEWRAGVRCTHVGLLMACGFVGAIHMVQVNKTQLDNQPLTSDAKKHACLLECEGRTCRVYYRV